MAFLSAAALTQRCIVRLRQVAGVSTQAYSEPNLLLLLEECYEQCRALRWWDHLTTWQTRTLDGTTGKFTTDVLGARERMRDVQSVWSPDRQQPLPMVNQHNTPMRISGTRPRMVEALSVVDDPAGTRLFRVWPLQSTGEVLFRVRCDPPDLFTNVAAIVPFDASVLVNGACMKYAVMDGTNPGSMAEFDRAYNERVMQLQQQHDSTPLQLDSRNRWQDEWREEYP